MFVKENPNRKKKKTTNKRSKFRDSWKYFCDQPIKSYIKVHENARKITIGQGDDYTTG